MNNIKWLEEWYFSHCNGDWEHEYGIKLETLDNPGWILRIDLTDTGLEEKKFVSVKIERTEDDWIHCYLKDDQFFAAGGPFNLDEILTTFRNWVEG